MKALKFITGFACAASIFIAGAENVDGSCDLVWTISWAAFALLCGWAYGKIENKEAENV